jgi:outer membrane protein
VLLAACPALACAPVEVRPEPPLRPSAPLSLADAVALALRNNPDVRIGRQRVLQAAEMVDEAASLFWPSISAGATFARTDRPSRVFASVLDQEDFTPALDFNAPGARSDLRAEVAGGVTLYDGGRRRARLSQAESRLGTAGAQEREVRSMVAFEVARAWHRILAARVAAETSALDSQVLEQLVAHAESERDVGAALASDARALRVRRDEARLAAGAAHDGARRATSGLLLLLGLGVEQRVELRPEAAPDAGELEPLAALLERARFARPELARAEFEIEAALSALRATEAGYRPELRVFGELGSNSESARLEHSNWLFGVGLVERINDALRTPSRVRSATAALRIAHETGRRTLLEVEGEVEAAWLDAAHAERALLAARAARVRDDDALRRTRAEREAGAARATALLAATLAAERARARERIAELERDMARIALAHALGEYPAPPEGAR